MYLNREIENYILEAAKSFPVITIYGARQVGKTTTVERLFGDRFSLISLDDTDEVMLATGNPKAFLESHPWPVIIDEIQKAPGLLNEIKRIVDEQRRIWLKNDEPRSLMFVLTGSNQFYLQEGVSESLAGRTAVINMSGLTQMEKRQIKGHLFDVDFERLLTRQSRISDLYQPVSNVFETIFQGSMPDVVTGVSQRELYYRSYIDTYIERDVRKLISASNEMQFRRFLSLLALRTSQVLVYNELANDIGIDVATCKRWLSILKTSGIIYFLEPYMSNISKRIIKSPKMYFMDTGLCAYLCRWPNSEMLQDCAMNGAFFETFVVSEVIKSFYNNGIDPETCLYYYRDIDKKEVDLLLVQNGSICPVEIKKNSNPTKPTKNFSILEKYGQPVLRGMVIDTTDAIRAINDNAFTLPVSFLGI